MEYIPSGKKRHAIRRVDEPVLHSSRSAVGRVDLVLQFVR